MEMSLIKSQNYKNNVLIKEAKKDRHVPDDFYSTTNQQTFIFMNNRWIEVKHQRMDALIVINEFGPFCKKLRDIKKGDKVVCGSTGIKIVDQGKEESDKEFSFMNNQVSSEKRNDILIQDLASQLVHENKKLTIVAGPVVVHTGGDYYLAELIRNNYIASILTGNALAVHDIEKNLFGTSLGVCSKTGKSVENGYRNHMRAINQVNAYGSIKDTVEAEKIKSGIMYECIKNNVPFVLAGSLRDDGPLPDTITDMIEAQDEYSQMLLNADIVLVLGSMLHGIATGNMLSDKVQMICVDINSAVVNKLSDRGSAHVKGIVTDAGLFLNLLSKEIKLLEIKN
ncbi:MAG TPA: TIGR00300 family protein [Tissierellaceae bacterium]|nr:TIGR00300 family protein [Tissierellaceae bacterium]